MPILRRRGRQQQRPAWFLLRASTKHGPYYLGTMRAMLKRKQFVPGDLVWHPSFGSTWKEPGVAIIPKLPSRRRQTQIERRRLKEQRAAARKARRPGQVRRIRALPRRAAVLEYVKIVQEDLLNNRYTLARAAALLGCKRHTVYRLIREKLHLHQSVTGLRQFCGLRTREKRSGSAAGARSPLLQDLLALTTPTGILGVVARVNASKGEKEARKVLKFLDRAMAAPERYAEKLANLSRAYPAGWLPGGATTRPAGRPVPPPPAPRSPLVPPPVAPVPAVATAGESTAARRAKRLEMARNFEKARRYEDAAHIYEELEMWEEAGRVRGVDRAQSAPVAKVDIGTIVGTQVQGDLVEPGGTSIRDSVVSRSAVGAGEPVPGGGTGDARTLQVCPFCGERLNLPKTPRFCPYCTEKLDGVMRPPG